jgi:hypothetical protein
MLFFTDVAGRLLHSADLLHWRINYLWTKQLLERIGVLFYFFQKLLTQLDDSVFFPFVANFSASSI